MGGKKNELFTWIWLILKKAQATSGDLRAELPGDQLGRECNGAPEQGLEKPNGKKLSVSGELLRGDWKGNKSVS